jgi:N utilization substance protein B
MVSARRKARTLALQALYEADTVGHDARVVLERMARETRLSEDNISFARDLVDGVMKYRPRIDQYIKTFAPAWPVSQMPAIDRNVLRLAIFEILIDNRIPVKIGINEAVELAKAFGSDNSPKFVNGVLGALVLNVKNDESVEI